MLSNIKKSKSDSIKEIPNISILTDIRCIISNSVGNLISNTFYTINYINGESYLELDRYFFDNIKISDYKTILIKILLSLQKVGNNIDYIKLPKDLSKDEKRGIFTIVYENFPIIGIDRSKKGQELLNINFFGIKDLNELVGKDTVDLFILGLKKVIISNFDKNSINGRLIINSYKNLSFSYENENNILTELLGDFNDIKQLIDYIFLNFLDNLEKEPIKNKQIKDCFYKYFSLGFGNSKIKCDNKSFKLYCYFKSYIGSKIKDNSNNFKLNNYSLLKLINESRKISDIENQIIILFEGQKILINGNKIDIIKNNNGRKKINKKILSYFRKGGKISPDNLSLFLSDYMRLINENFDFISPLNFSEDIYDNNDVLLLNEGIINTIFITKNHKGFYNKDTFNFITDKKQGINIFIDVADMGILNLVDGVDVSNAISNREDKKIILKKRLLHGGITGTTKMTNLSNNINREFRGVNISVGGDEFFLHFPYGTPINIILEKIEKMFNDVGLETRLSYGIDGDIEYNSLDEITKINKLIKSIIDKENIVHNVKTIESYIDPKLKNYILNNLDLLIKELEKNIDTEKFINVLNGNNKSIISKIKLLEYEGDKNNTFDNDQYINLVVSLSKTDSGFKVIIGNE